MKNKILLRLFAAILLAFSLQSTAYSLEIANGAVSNLTATNAWLVGNLTATNSTNTTLTCYYGAGHGGTNPALWQYSNQWGVATSLTNISILTTNLPPATYIYYRWRAVGTSTAWAATASNFTTLSTLPTNFPAATGGVFLLIDTNGAFLAPTAAKIIAANSLASAPQITNLQFQIEVVSGRVNVAEGNIAANTTNISLHVADTNNPHAVTPTQIGAVPTNNPTFLTILRSMTNYVAIAASSNYLIYDPVTRLLTGCVTNQGGAGGGGNVFLASNNVFAAGTTQFLVSVTMSNALNMNNQMITNIANLQTTSITLGTNAAITNWHDPFQQYSAEIYAGAGGTATVVFGHGSLLRLVATNSPTTLTFDSSGYATNGVSRVGVEILAGTNSIGFANTTITNATAPTISTSTWTSLFFRRVEGGLWKGRQ